MPIKGFLFRHICIFRPKKKTFHILEWSQQKGQWFPYTGAIHPNDIRIRRSLEHEEDTVILPFHRRSVTMVCMGYYLQISDFEGRTVSRYIPICLKYPGDILPPSILKYATPYPTQTFIESHSLKLWEQACSIPPLPPRIAFILARDAEQCLERCPITLDTIRSTTARVTTCYHVFNGEAIQKWLEKNSKCPVCNEVCIASPTVS
jgi:hypothetical protein